MALIKKFEDIVAWQEARKLVADIYKLTSSGALAKDYGLRDQLQRAAVSAMTNIAEGFDCESKIEFTRFLGIARRSAVDVGYINHETFNAEYQQAEKTKALIGGLKRSLTSK